MRAIPAVAVAAIVLAGEARPAAWGLEVHRLLTVRALDALPPPPRTVRRRQARIHSRALGQSQSLARRRPAWRARSGGRESFSRHRRSRRAGAVHERAPGVGSLRRALRRQSGQPDGPVALARRGYRRPARKAFRSIGCSPYAADNARYLIAVLAHYLADAHQPFHAVMNYDGQLTNQRGIHARFETELVMRNWQSLKLAPVRITSGPKHPRSRFRPSSKAPRSCRTSSPPIAALLPGAISMTMRTSRRCCRGRAAVLEARLQRIGERARERRGLGVEARGRKPNLTEVRRAR